MIPLETLQLARLRFDLETLEELDVPAYKGNMLRTTLLWWLSDFWCLMPERCRNGCQKPDVCTFGRMNEPPVDPSWSSSTRHLIGNSSPPAYALWDSGDRRPHLHIGDTWGFEMTLIGDLALQQLPAFVAAVQQGAERGMGRIKLRSRVRRVVAVSGVGESQAQHVLAAEGNEGLLVWRSYHLDDITFGWQEARRWAESAGSSVRTISLRYLSPVKIKERGKWVEEPSFSPVMKALVRRLRILSEVHGDGEWPHDEWGPLLDLAETVRMAHVETEQSGYWRYSKRSGAHRLNGFVGQAWYTGEDIRPLLPALWLGQWLHIGKAYVLGNGRYIIEQVF